MVYPESDPRSRITTSLDFAVFQTLKNETDRAAALLGAAYIDNYLADMFRVRLHADSQGRLFGRGGPLSSFASKIDLAYGLGWLSVDVWTDLHVIRKIRNDFAHNPDHMLSFATKSNNDQTLSLTVRAKWMKLYQGDFAPHAMELKVALETPRGRFECAVAEATAFIVRAIGHGVLLTGPYPTPSPRPE